MNTESLNSWPITNSLPHLGEGATKRCSGKDARPVSLQRNSVPGGWGWATVTLGILAKGVPYKQVDQTSLLFYIGSSDNRATPNNGFQLGHPEAPYSMDLGTTPPPKSQYKPETEQTDWTVGLRSLVHPGSSGLIWCIYLNSRFRFVWLKSSEAL